MTVSRFLKGLFFFALVTTASASLWTPWLQASSGSGSGVRLTEVSEPAGVSFTHANNLDEIFRFQPTISHLNNWLEAISGAVAVVDLNKDGHYDFFLTSTELGSRSALYINRGDGTFEDQTKQYNLEYLLTPARPVFFDCDNDGQMELLITSHMRNSIYKMDAEGKFQFFHLLSTSFKPQISLAVNIIDYNRDGNLDVVLSGMGHLNAPESMVSAENGDLAQLLEGDGSCTFKNRSEKLGFNRKVFMHAIGVGDFWDRGQAQDLWIATDFNEDHILRHEDSGYTDVSSFKKKGQSQNGMAAEVFYEKNSRFPSIYVSHIFEPGYFTDGNKVWSWDEENQSYVNKARSMKVNRCGWGWGGVMTDLENDGDLDLLVVNGFVSGESRSNWWFKISTTVNSSRALVGNPMYWPKMDDLDLSGHQRDCVFVNEGDGTYTNIAEMLNFDSGKRDGRGIARIDFNNDGLPDFVIANQKQQAELYRNDSDAGNAWVGFDLVATKTHWQALGTKLTLYFKDGSFLKRYHNPYNGYASQHDPRHVFGLGASEPDRLEIEWPSGVRTTIRDFENRTYRKVSDEQ